MSSKIWTGLLMAMLLPLTARAEVALLYWPKAKVPIETRKQMELIARDVAIQYAQQNDMMEFGPIDFLHSDTNVKIHVWTDEPDEPMYYLWGEIFCHVNVTLDLQEFRQKLMHEFSHLYDYTKLDQLRAERKKKDPVLDFRIKKRRIKDPLTAYVKDNDTNEARAKKREMAYITGAGKLRPEPCTAHPQPNACVKSFDFKKAQREGVEDRIFKSFLDAASRYGAAPIPHAKKPKRIR